MASKIDAVLDLVKKAEAIVTKKSNDKESNAVQAAAELKKARDLVKSDAKLKNAILGKSFDKERTIVWYFDSAIEVLDDVVVMAKKDGKFDHALFSLGVDEVEDLRRELTNKKSSLS